MLMEFIRYMGDKLDATRMSLVEKQADLFKILGNARRLYIVQLLSDGELSVNEITANVGSSLQNVSQHLSLLKKYGFVTNRREGQTIYYQVASLDFLKQISTLLRVPLTLE